MQLELFKVAQPERVYLNVSLSSEVYGDDLPIETIGWGHYRRWESDFFHLEIGLAPWDASPVGHNGILWLWSACINDVGTSHESCTYILNPKWNKFAKCREDAIWFACDELEDHLAKHKESWKQYSQAHAWIENTRWRAHYSKEKRGKV